MSVEAYVNTDLKPSEVKNFPWLVCADNEIEKKYCDNEPSGKWMMFFPVVDVDRQWSVACNLFRQGKLTGIFKMKVSTAYKIKGASRKSEGVLIFFCGPAYNEAAVMEYGKNLLNYIEYTPPFGGKMYYEQSTVGTKIARQNIYYRYEIDTINY